MLKKYFLTNISHEYTFTVKSPWRKFVLCDEQSKTTQTQVRESAFLAIIFIAMYTRLILYRVLFISEHTRIVTIDIHPLLPFVHETAYRFTLK